MELIKIENISFPVGVTQEHKDIVLASRQTPLREYSKTELIQAVSIQVDKAKNLTGQQNAERQIILECIDTISDKIKAGKFGSLTAQQFGLSIERGALGEYGEFFGINALTINLWITSFYKQQLKFRKVQSAYEEKVKAEQSEQEISQHFKENSEKYMLGRLRKEYEAIIRNPSHSVYDLNEYFYIYLQSSRKLPIDNPRKEEFMEQAKEVIKKRLEEEKEMAKSHQKTIIGSWIKDITKMLEEKPKKNREFRGVVKNLILKDYMKNCIEIGMTFEEMAFDK